MRDEWERHGVSHIRSLHLRSLRSLRHPFASVSTAVSLFLSYLRLSLRSFLGSHVTRLISSSSTRSSFTSVSRLLVPLSLGPPSLCSLVSRKVSKVSEVDDERSVATVKRERKEPPLTVPRETALHSPLSPRGVSCLVHARLSSSPPARTGSAGGTEWRR